MSNLNSTIKINQEKQDILDIKNKNILVTANPGTGKTLLLAHKYLSLVKDGIEPKNILCLTFTEKAKSEMEKRILDLQKKSKIQMDVSQLNVCTFHSYALSQLEQREIISSNLLRSEIYLYIKEKDLLNYQDDYIIDNIVPKIDTLIKYLKSFGVLPKDINTEKAEKELLKNKDHDDEKYSDSDKVHLLQNIIEIYKKYEDNKKSKGYDYADLLIEFSKLKKNKFDYVLIDELQDLNRIEAEIALESTDRFIAVGDKKQAIFGFQGGSIINFDLFEKSTKSILSENFRSTDQILSYAKNYFITNTKNTDHKHELENLKNATGHNGKMPIIIKIDRQSDPSKHAADVLENIINNSKETNGSDKTTAIITRTNRQIKTISEELEKRDIKFATTFFSGSKNTKSDILNFLRGIISDDVQIIKNAMFTPYFPITIQRAFKLADKEYNSSEDILEDIKPFKELKDKIKDKYDVLKLFHDRILPIAVSHGKQHYYAATKINDAFTEALELLGDKNLDNVINYVRLYDLTMEETEENSPIILTTVHKAKGREFNNVIYLPTSTRNNERIFDTIVQSILESRNINAKEELQEESFRIDFVAFTRAKDQLFIITDKENKYLNEKFSQSESEICESRDSVSEPTAYKLEAYKLFVNEQYEEAKKLLKDRDCWLIDFINGYFKKLDSISFSSIERKPFEYLTNDILKIKVSSPALNLGGEVHAIAEKKLKGEDYKTDDEYKPYEKNIDELLASEFIAEYPEVHCVEEFFEVPLSKISDIKEDIKFRGKIDVVLKKDGKYLMLDWKTDKRNEKGSKHRRQLEAYRTAFCHLNNIKKDNAQVAIAYIGLKPKVNTGEIHWELDTKQPAPSASGTVEKKLKKIVDWKNYPENFIRELSSQKDMGNNEVLWKNVVEQYIYEYQENQKKLAKDRA